MSGQPLEQANVCIDRIRLDFEDLQAERVSLSLVTRRTSEALAVVSACMAHLSVAQTEVVEARLRDAAHVVDALVSDLDAASREWGSTCSRSLRSIIRGGGA